MVPTASTVGEIDMTELLLGAFFAVLAVIVARTLWAYWKGTMIEDHPRLMRRMLERQGVADVAPPDGEPALRAATTALQRCVRCKDAEACLHWLDEGKTSGYEAFCPNVDYIESLKAAKKRAPQGAHPA